MKKRPEEGDIYREGILTLIWVKELKCESNFHTFFGSSVIFDQCHMVWRAVAIKLQHLRTCLPHMGDEGMTLLNSCQVLKSLAYCNTHRPSSLAPDMN